MTKKEFRYMWKICKKIWKELAETGAKIKPDYAAEFLFFCPACEISGDGYDRDCRKCPIDRWRSKDNDEGLGSCEKEGMAYYQWKNGDYNTRKKAARRISKYKWTYLPEYKNKKFKKCFMIKGVK